MCCCGVQSRKRPSHVLQNWREGDANTCCPRYPLLLRLSARMVPPPARLLHEPRRRHVAFACLLPLPCLAGDHQGHRAGAAVAAARAGGGAGAAGPAARRGRQTEDGSGGRHALQHAAAGAPGPVQRRSTGGRRCVRLPVWLSDCHPACWGDLSVVPCSQGCYSPPSVAR